MNTSKDIDGFLYLPALGLIISCVTGTTNALGVAILLLSKMYNHHPVSGFFAFIMLISCALYLCTLYTATYLFFKKMNKAKYFMVFYYFVNIVVNAPVILYSWLWLGFDIEMKELGIIFSLMFDIIVLIPYFLFSRRVDNVFCR